MIDSNYRKGFILAAAAAIIIALSGWLGGWVIEHRRSQQYDGALRQMINLMAIPDVASTEAKFDTVRHFIHSHSRHKSDAAFWKLRGNKNLIAQGVIDHASGRTKEPVHMECSTRSSLMGNVLRKLGFKTRTVYVFDTDPKSDGKLRSHTFLDVFNPSTGKWESQDPDYDFFWSSVSEGVRISVFEAPEHLSEIQPCDRSRCGWDLISDEGKAIKQVHELIDVVSIVDKTTDQRISRFTSRADLNAEFSFYDRKGTFCEVFGKLCRTVIRDENSPR